MFLNKKFLMFPFIKLLLSIFFIQNYPKQKKRARKVFCCEINGSRVLFSFPSCDLVIIISSNHGTSYMEN